MIWLVLIVIVGCFVVWMRRDNQIKNIDIDLYHARRAAEEDPDNQGIQRLVFFTEEVKRRVNGLAALESVKNQVADAIVAAEAQIVANSTNEIQAAPIPAIKTAEPVNRGAAQVLAESDLQKLRAYVYPILSAENDLLINSTKALTDAQRHGLMDTFRRRVCDIYLRKLSMRTEKEFLCIWNSAISAAFRQFVNTEATARDVIKAIIRTSELFILRTYKDAIGQFASLHRPDDGMISGLILQFRRELSDLRRRT